MNEENWRDDPALKNHIEQALARSVERGESLTVIAFKGLQRWRQLPSKVVDLLICEGMRSVLEAAEQTANRVGKHPGRCQEKEVQEVLEQNRKISELLAWAVPPLVDAGMLSDKASREQQIRGVCRLLRCDLLDADREELEPRLKALLKKKAGEVREQERRGEIKATVLRSLAVSERAAYLERLEGYARDNRKGIPKSLPSFTLEDLGTWEQLESNIIAGATSRREFIRLCRVLLEKESKERICDLSSEGLKEVVEAMEQYMLHGQKGRGKKGESCEPAA